MAASVAGLRELDPAELLDTPTAWPVIDRRTQHAGAIFDTVTERLQTPDGSEITRDYVQSRGAVGVIALDSADRVVLVRQYRHPVRHRLWEPPAGLLDVADEPPVVGAARELAEEAQLAAGQWHVLADLMTSPGMTSEIIRIFLARDLSPTAAPDGFVAEGEEALIERACVPLDDVVRAVLAGRVQNPLLVSGCLAAWASRAADHRDLRPADTPWPAREQALLGGENPAEGAR